MGTVVILRWSGNGKIMVKQLPQLIRIKHSALWPFHKAKLELTRANHQQLQAGHAYDEQNTAALNTSSVV